MSVALWLRFWSRLLCLSRRRGLSESPSALLGAIQFMGPDLSFPAFHYLVPLASFLLAASWWDIKSRHIPNFLVLSGTIFGLCWNVVAPGSLGAVSAILGIVFGLGLLLPLYLMRAMGAGDVKLMAMVGAFVGPADVLGAVLGTLVAGGILAVAYALHAGSMRRLAVNFRFMLLDGFSRWVVRKVPQASDIQVSAGHLPYALAITLGTLGYLGWRNFGQSMGF